MQTLLLVGIGGGLGAVARYGAGLAVAWLWPMAFPLGTLLVNLAGSLLMGLFAGALTHHSGPGVEALRLFVAVGLLGGFTTFSAFSLDAVRLIERGELLQAGAYVLLSVVLCLIGLYLGLLVTRGVA
jgi:CrcB protein